MLPRLADTGEVAFNAGLFVLTPLIAVRASGDAVIPGRPASGRAMGIGAGEDPFISLGPRTPIGRVPTSADELTALSLLFAS